MFDISEQLPESMIVGFLESDEECTVEVDLLVAIGVYSRKDTAVDALKRNFVDGIDFSACNRKTSLGGRPSQSYVLTSDCFKAMCMMAETELGRQVRKYYLAIERKWKASHQQPQAPYFYQRLQLFHERTGRIPEGYFCIFEETISLISRLEYHGYLIPDDARLDASIGKCFCKFMRAEHGIEPDDYCLSYPHWFPGKPHPVPANLYPVEWLSTFRKWLESRYYRYQLPKYFKGRKDAVAIEAVNRFLGLLPGS